MTIEQRFPIGTKFKRRTKPQPVCTVVDVLRTYNNAGELVRLRYVATHELLGQTIKDCEVTDTAIAMGVHLLGEGA